MDLKELEKNRKIIETSYMMYEERKVKTEKNMKNTFDKDGNPKFSQEEINKTIELINDAQQDKVKEYIQNGGNIEDLEKLKTKKRRNKNINNFINEEINYLLGYNDEVNLKDKNKEKKDNIKEREEVMENIINNISKNEDPIVLPSKGEYNPQEAFDVIPLPSKGECYKNKTGKISVGYLTAYDENMIVSPNLYRDNLIFDYLLNEKIINNDINPYDMIEGDRDAIILFLRASGYGTEYPITATDNETGVEFETYVDLSKLKFKEFNLKGDENGWFDYTLPVSKHNIKFKFLTHRDLMNLDKINEIENKRLIKNKINEYVESLTFYIENENELDKLEIAKIKQAIRTIEQWEEKMSEDDSMKYNHSMTNRLILSIMSINGNTDREYISNFVKTMNVKDSSSLRKYISKNEPGIDYNIEIQKPESLGGGSMSVFLQLDQFIFLNVAE